MVQTDATIDREDAPVPRPRSLADARHLAILDDLTRALETRLDIEPAAALCLRALCACGPWSGARFDLTRCDRRGSSLPPVSVHHPAISDVGGKDKQPGTLAADPVAIDIGSAGTAGLALYRDGSVDIAPDDDVVVSVVAALLRGIVERSLFLEDREKAEADRVHRWGLLKQSEDSLREQYARLYTAINNLSHGLAMYDGDGRIAFCNTLYATMYGLTAADVRPGATMWQIAKRRRANGFEITDAVQAGAFETDGALALKNESRTWPLADGRRILVSVQPLWNGGWVTTHEDTTERERFEARISHLAHHDALTDLANRVLFREHLDQALANATTGDDRLAVLWLDLDRFKAINDTMGHIMGDLVLKAVARRLMGCVRESDVVARLGGDEFAILQVPAKGRAEVEMLARRIHEVISAPFRIEGQRINVGTSIGICMAPDDTDNADQMLLHADTALYRAKAEGRSTYRFFRPDMDAANRRRRQLEVDLHRALDDEMFELHYQPIIDLNTGEIVTCEALLRWSHPKLGSIAPSDFIPVAEEAGLMDRLGHWVLKRACRDAAAWPTRATVAVNVSPSQLLSHKLTMSVLEALDASGLPPERLEIEITEAVMMQPTEAALQALADLRRRGVGLAMDDFGTGYSSLAHLGRLPFSKIKIDRSFVAGLPDDRNSHAIVRAITGLAEGLGVITTAEGVETDSQLAAVLALGCDQVQGFFVCAPINGATLLRVLAERAPYESHLVRSRRHRRDGARDETADAVDHAALRQAS